MRPSDVGLAVPDDRERCSGYRGAFLMPIRRECHSPIGVVTPR